MLVNTMNQSQMMILESFAGAQDEQEVNDLMDVLRSFYAQRLEKEMQRLWDNGTLDDHQLEHVLDSKFPTFRVMGLDEFAERMTDDSVTE